jgi:hypothetical protein
MLLSTTVAHALADADAAEAEVKVQLVARLSMVFGTGSAAGAAETAERSEATSTAFLKSAMLNERKVLQNECRKLDE